MNKYRAKKSGDYDSKKEHRRAVELELLAKLNKISNLRKQVKYELLPSQKTEDGKTIERPVSYYADFVYIEDGKEIVEDTKGMRTTDYIIKRKLMLFIHGIRIKEI